MKLIDNERTIYETPESSLKFRGLSIKALLFIPSLNLYIIAESGGIMIKHIDKNAPSLVFRLTGCSSVHLRSKLSTRLITNSRKGVFIFDLNKKKILSKIEHPEIMSYMVRDYVFTACDFSVFGPASNKAIGVDNQRNYVIYHLDRSPYRCQRSVNQTGKFETYAHYSLGRLYRVAGSPDGKMVFYLIQTPGRLSSVLAYRVMEGGTLVCFFIYYPNLKAQSSWISFECILSKKEKKPLVVFTNGRFGVVMVVGLEKKSHPEKADELVVEQTKFFETKIEFGSSNLAKVGDRYYFVDHSDSGLVKMVVGAKKK